MHRRHSAVWIGVFTMLACGGDRAPDVPRESGAEPVDPPVGDVEPVDPPPPGVKPDGTIVSAVQWFEGSFEQALAEARRSEKLVFVEIGAYWCPPCHELEEKTFVDPRVGAYLAQKYVAVHIDAEKGEGPEITERYQVQAYPTILVLEPAGVEKDRILDFVEPAPLLEMLGAIEAGTNVLAGLAAAAAAAPDDAQAAYAYGNALALAARRDEAMQQFDKVLAADPDNAKGLAAQVLYDRALLITFKIDADPTGAVAAYRELQAKYPASKPAVRAHRQLGRVLNDLGKPDEAIQELDAMVATNPDDVDLKSSYGWFCFRERCKPEKGLVVIRAAQKQAPESAELHYLEAELHHLLGDDAAALAAIQKATDLEPTKAYYRRQAQRFRGLSEQTG